VTPFICWRTYVIILGLAVGQLVIHFSGQVFTFWPPRASLDKHVNVFELLFIKTKGFAVKQKSVFEDARLATMLL
jgi:hypothetical protein